MRNMLKQSFNYLNTRKWKKGVVKKFNKILFTLPLNINDDKVPDGISYHIADIYLEELAKFGDDLKPAKAVAMLQPFVKLTATSKK
jgi:ribosomal RNA-processing protein 1